jgi:peptidoglycan/LPS O-acetylase OafA/YrhL
MPTTSTARRPTLPALTGIRFFAALAVLAHHFASPTNRYIAAANEHGIVGVTLFFILSGFILSYTYLISPGEIKATHRQFWAARFARIYPMYVVAFLIMAPLILAWSKSGHVWWSGLAALTLTQAWLGIGLCEWNPPGWSLSAEAFFYFLFPFLVKPVSRLGRGAMMGLLAACWVASLAATATYAATGAVDRNVWLFHPVLRLPEFLLGMTGGVLWLGLDARSKAVFRYAAEIGTVLLLGVLCIPMHEAWVMNGALAPFFLLLIFGLAAGSGPMARMLSHKAFVLLGGASFSLYIIHWPMWYGTKLIVDRLHLHVGTMATFWLITVAVIVPASIVCFKLVEEPVNKRLRRWFASERSPVAPSALVEDVLRT